MFKKCFKTIVAILLIILVGNLVIVRAVEAQSSVGSDILNNLGIAGRASGLQEPSLPTMVAWVIQGALGLLVIIFFVLIVIAGFKWMTAGGNEETVAKAKKNIINAIIGAVIVIMAYAITAFVFNVILGEV